MARRGRCRCGTVLQFHKGSEGYKMRCPSCSSVVRLRGRAKRDTGKRSSSHPVPASPRPAVPVSSLDRALQHVNAPTQQLDAVEARQLAVPLTDAVPVTDQVISAAAAALPSRIVAAVGAGAGEPATGICENCGKAIPSHRKCCPECDTRSLLLDSIQKEAVDVEPCPVPAGRIPRNWRREHLQRWLLIGLVVGMVCAAVVLWALWQWGTGTL